MTKASDPVFTSDLVDIQWCTHCNKNVGWSKKGYRWYCTDNLERHLGPAIPEKATSKVQTDWITRVMRRSTPIYLSIGANYVTLESSDEEAKETWKKLKKMVDTYFKTSFSKDV